MYTPTSLYPGDKYFSSFTSTWHCTPYPAISPLLPSLRATTRTVFITGGGTGIGKATALAFARAGAKSIAIFGRRETKLQSAAEEIRLANPDGTTKVVFEAVDLSQAADVSVAFARALAAAGSSHIDIFIHSAGILQPPGLLSIYPSSSFHTGLSINIAGAFNAVQAMLPLLSPGAAVFNISSCIAHVQRMPGCWAYAASKLANAKMFEYLGAENEGLRVVNVHPGIVDTEINAGGEMDGVGVDDGKSRRWVIIWRCWLIGINS
jgi:NAD(P)-dependent dehydrogenase (short-subunit alcohol dehydrogenase family)